MHVCSYSWLCKMSDKNYNLKFEPLSANLMLTYNGKGIVFDTTYSLEHSLIHNESHFAVLNQTCCRSGLHNCYTLRMRFNTSTYMDDSSKIFVGFCGHQLSGRIYDILKEQNTYLWEIVDGIVYFDGVKQQVMASKCRNANMFEITVDMENNTLTCQVVGGVHSTDLEIPDLPEQLWVVVGCYTGTIPFTCEVVSFKQSRPFLPSILDQVCFDQNSAYGPLNVNIHHNKRNVTRDDITSNCFILLNQIIKDGKHIMTFKIIKDTGASLCIGLASPGFTLPESVMFDRTHPIYVIKGLTLWRSYRGLIYVNGVEQKYSLPLSEYKDDRFPIIIEIYLDCSTGKAELYKNGKSIGIVFEDICPPVQPIVAFYAGYEKEVEVIEYCCSIPRKIAIQKQQEQSQQTVSFMRKQGDLTITNEGATLERSEGSTGNSYAILNVNCTSGIYKITFAVELDDGASTVIGIAGEQLGTIKKDSKIYLERWVCAYRSYKGILYAYGREQPKRLEPFWENGTLIQMIINMDRRIVEFEINGTPQGVAFTEIPKPAIPFVGFYAEHSKSFSLLHFAHSRSISLESSTIPLQVEMNDLNSTSTRSGQNSLLNADVGGMLVLNDCLVCGAQNKNVVYMPCMHGVHCPNDATIFQRCPLCEQEVTSMFNIF